MTPGWTYTGCYVKEMYEAIGIIRPEQLDFGMIAGRLGNNDFLLSRAKPSTVF